MRSNQWRGWWKPWNWSTRSWLVCLVGAAIAWPICWRWFCLWQIPDVALPFSLEEVYQRDNSNQENALGKYQPIVRKFDSAKTAWSSAAIDKAIDQDQPAWDDQLDGFLIKHAEIVDDLRQASEMEWLQIVPTKSLGIYTLIAPLDRFREMVKFLEAESLRRQRSGQLQEAWSLYPVMFGIARHAEMQGFGMARMMGGNFRGIACAGLGRWASNRSLTADQLRQTRLEFDGLSSSRMSLADVLKVEYAMVKNSEAHPNFPDALLPQWILDRTNRPEFAAVKRGFLWMVGQPEVAVRICRQVIVNNLDSIDLPRNKTRAVFDEDETVVFELKPDAKIQRGQMSSTQLSRTLQSTIGKTYSKTDLHASTGVFRRGLHIETARIAATRMLLAAQQYQRLHGEFPASADDLLPEILDQIPEDPFSDKGQLMNYRRDAVDRAIVWSVGQNGVDDEGHLDIIDSSTPAKDVGYRITLSKKDEPEN